ncbi:MAG TPA: serpin family protein [Steroidobacteraceae bacterium]|nr:serpin family protein [Steroidobacteraceae bacterium]
MLRNPAVLTIFAAATMFAAPSTRGAPPSPPADVAAADNAFGFRLLNAVQKTLPKGNVVLSPISAALNLSMVLNGAGGQTREEILAALSLTGSELAAINAANAQLIKVIRTPAKSILLSVADSIWVDNRRATLRPDYVKQMQAAYDAQMADLDFSDPGAATRINSWASQETHGKIPKVIERIDPADLVLLLNAVYFKGQWTHPFDKAQTQQRDFSLAGGAVKQVPRMAQSGRFDYFESPDMQAIRLPFGEGDLVMEVLLPAKSSSLGALEAELTSEHWKGWQAQYAPRSGKIELPRFELKSNYRLNEPLQALGMTRAFRSEGPDAAQLTGMFSSAAGQARAQGFAISSVLQSTYWKVDEEGSEAAAVTTTGIRATAVARPERPFQMIVDRPYFCAIIDRRNGALLFVGAIYDPAV